MDESNDVLFEEYDNKGIIILNRPKYYNALTVSMDERIADVLQKWEKEKEMVIIKAAGDKAFCSGGDLRFVLFEYKSVYLLNTDIFVSLKQTIRKSIWGTIIVNHRTVSNRA